MFTRLFSRAKPEETFWKFIEEARRSSGKISEVSSHWEGCLAAATESDLVGFQTGLAQEFERAFQPRLWAAAHLVSSGGTRFQVQSLVFWLMLQGRERFEQVLAEPALLESFDPNETLPQAEFKDVALRAAKLGQHRELELPPLKTHALLGTMFADGRFAALEAAQERAAELFPGLAKKFWNAEAAEARSRQSRGRFQEAVKQQAEQGQGFACRSMGAIYYEGRQVEQDLEKAAHYFCRGAENGDPGCQYMYGCLLLRGEGVAVNRPEAALWLECAAKQGDRDAQFELGLLNLHGKGVPEERSQALEWLRRAAEAGVVAAQATLGDLYAQGKKMERDDGAAFRWYELAAGNGHRGAMFMTGMFCLAGRGTPQDDQAAVRWLEQAAAQGHPKALCQLGICHARGRGVPQNYARAKEYYEQAAQHNVGMAVNNLADLHENGHGVPMDLALAARLYHRAAELGSIVAKRSLGDFYERGLGVETDRTKAIWFYQQAADAGDQESIQHLARLKAVTPE